MPPLRQKVPSLNLICGSLCLHVLSCQRGLSVGTSASLLFYNHFHADRFPIQSANNCAFMYKHIRSPVNKVSAGSTLLVSPVTMSTKEKSALTLIAN